MAKQLNQRLKPRAAAALRAVVNDLVRNRGCTRSFTEAELGSILQAARQRLLQFLITSHGRRLGLDDVAEPASSPITNIDVSSLLSDDVRQLGTIYEHLLGYRLTADEGAASLVPDAAARKASGSFYTPAAIVAHLVEQTVGPVLAEKLDALRPLMRRARPADRAALFERRFDFKVFDPAMGCGAFLLEAARFITARAATFLQDAAVAVDRGSLYRRVLERCVYGLDKDDDAVELARHILWLDLASAEARSGIRQNSAGSAGILANSATSLRQGDALADSARSAGILANSATSLRQGDALADSVEKLLGTATFDAVIGNPPYLGVRTGGHDASFVAAAARFGTARRNWDIFGLFLERIFRGDWGRPRVGLVLPLRLTANRDFLPLRQMIFDASGPEQVIDCGKPFRGAAVAACVLVTPTTGGVARHAEIGHWHPPKPPRLWPVAHELLRSLPDLPLLTSLRPEQVPTFRRLTDSPCRLADHVSITRGMECGKNDANVRRTPAAGRVPVISGEGVEPFRVVPQGLFIPLGLQPRPRYKPPELFKRTPKLLLRFVAPYPIAAIDTQGVANFNTVYNAHGDAAVLYALAVLLNSRLIRWWFATAFNAGEDLFPHIQKYQLEQIPLPAGLSSSPVGKQLIRQGRAWACRPEQFHLRRSDHLACAAFGLAQVPPWLAT